MNPMSAWDELSSIVTVIAGSAAAVLAVGCLWPTPRPDRRPSYARHARALRQPAPSSRAAMPNCRCPNSSRTSTTHRCIPQLPAGATAGLASAARPGPFALSSCSPPAQPFGLADAHRDMQLHRDHTCARKRAAFAALVAAGRITPDSSRPRRS